MVSDKRQQELGQTILNVESIFNSLDGEFNGWLGIGQPSTFIRLRGCNLRCSYCDTKYAQEEDPKRLMTVNEILSFPGLLNKLTITGGEPLTQLFNLKALLALYLNDRGSSSKLRRITIETNGSICPFSSSLQSTSVAKNYQVRIVADYKLPSSGVEGKMDPDCFTSLRACDVIKFVVGTPEDLIRLEELLELHKKDWIAIKAISPCWRDGMYDRNVLGNCQQISKLAQLVIDKFSKYPNVTFSVQLHKILDLA